MYLSHSQYWSQKKLMHNDKLIMTDKELNMLANINEEAAEVIVELIKCLATVQKGTMKAVRFGLDESSNLRRAALNRPLLEIYETARSFLSVEVGQLQFLLDQAINSGLLLSEFVAKGYDEKKEAFATLKFNYVKIQET